MAGCLPYCEATSSPVQDSQAMNLNLDTLQFDMNTGGHEANRDSVPLIGGTDMDIFQLQFLK